MLSKGSGLLLIVTSAAIGYWFITNTYRYKYKAARKVGQHLYLMSVACGLIFTLLAYFIGEATLFFKDDWKHLSVGWDGNESSQYIHLFGCAFIISCLVSYAYNRKYGKAKSMRDEAEKNDLDAVVYRASSQSKPLQVTLQSRKVYIGMVLDSFEPSDENSYLTLIPLYSGYRTEADLEMTLTNKYPINPRTLNRDFIEDLGVVIPKESIVTCHIFNLKLYKQIGNQRSLTRKVV